MQRAIAETDRRRKRQEEHNEKQGITPKSIKKAVTDVMLDAHSFSPADRDRQLKVAEKATRYQHMSPAKLGKTITEMENKMMQHAEMLEFEEAAGMRDQIKQLKQQVLLES
jgi:excinuclease ABC subunit B